MKKQYVISNQKALGSEIKEIVAAVEPALVGKSKASAVIAMLSVAILLQEPELDPDQLASMIGDITKRIALLIENANSDTNDETVN